MGELFFNVVLLAGGIGVLYFGADWLVRGAARMAASLGLSAIVVGLTVVSLGTSAPELAVSVLAAVRGDPDIAMGNVMGSNLANIGLILGVTALARPLTVTGRVVRREVPIMIVVTLLLYPLLMDGELSRLDGGVLLVILVAYLAIVFRTVDDEEPEVVVEFEEFARISEHVSGGLRLRDVGLIAVGTVGLVVGGSSIVGSAEFIARELGISQLLISLSVIAVGTSLPELATSLVAALREESDIAVGNIIGSNVFNIAAVLGITSVVEPLAVADEVIGAYMPAVILMSLLAFPIAKRAYEIRRWEGAILLTAYFSAIYYLFTVGVIGT